MFEVYFDFVSELEHVVFIKANEEFDRFCVGMDFDVITYLENEKFQIQLIKLFNKFFGMNSSFSFKTDNHEFGGHFDIFKNTKLQFRIDFLNSLCFFKKVHMSDSIINSFFESKERFSFNNFSNYQLCLVDSGVMRYLNYLECFADYDYKKKHYEFITNQTVNVQNQIFSKIQAFVKLRREIYIPKQERNFTIDNKSHLTQSLLSIWSYLKLKLKFHLRKLFWIH